MTLNTLTDGERFIVEWQYSLLGGFPSALADAIKRADVVNLAKLRRGFPDEVDAFMNFSGTSGWWEAVERKAATPVVAKEDEE